MRNSLLKAVSIWIVVLVIIGLTLFAHREPTGETWGYWAFSRIFAETGKFIIIDRSPLYTLYLNIFRWMGYPLAVTVEYLITSLIIAISMIVFFKRYIGLFLSGLSVILWMPFFQAAEPPVQKLALACSFLAVDARVTKETRFRIALFYALIGCAYLLRSTYIVFIIVFAVWDIARILKGYGLKRVLVGFVPRISDWPVFCVSALLIWFNVMQSDHPWNNAWLATSKWFPNDGKSLSDASFIQHYNWQYIYSKYGDYKDKDFYFTNQEVFNGASTMLGAITANPGFVIKQVLRNTKKAFFILASLTLFAAIPGPIHYAVLLFFRVILVMAVFYAAFRAAENQLIKVFIIASALLIFIAILSLPKARYMHPIIPVFIFGAYWYAQKIRGIFKKMPRKMFSITANLGMCMMFVFFSPGLRDWNVVIKDFSHDVRHGQVNIMQARHYSLKAHFKQLQARFKDCNGVLTSEHTFVAAFTRLPIDRIYDIWEIPPFGRLNDSSYKGLSPLRIDCVTVPDDFADDVGYGTNSQIRYKNYIIPYTKNMKDKGAKAYRIDGFGEVVVLPK